MIKLATCEYLTYALAALLYDGAGYFKKHFSLSWQRQFVIKLATCEYLTYGLAALLYDRAGYFKKHISFS